MHVYLSLIFEWSGFTEKILSPDFLRCGVAMARKEDAMAIWEDPLMFTRRDVILNIIQLFRSSSLDRFVLRYNT